MKQKQARPIQVVRAELRKIGKTLVRSKNDNGVVMYGVMPDKKNFASLGDIAKEYKFN